MSRNFRVTVCKDYLGFSSAHFITLLGHTCESLHGHNYRVGVTVVGDVDPECSFVVDFGVLKRIVRPHVEKIDHRVLLPTKNPKLVLREEGDSLEVDYLGRVRYTFPRADCALLPVTNTTAEMIAEYFALMIRDNLVQTGLSTLSTIEVEIEETIGQSAFFTVPFGS